MSQSASTVRDVADATRSHKAMSNMMRQGRSFSGRERNCFFLNTGERSSDAPRFANISALSGVDWPDDGRGLAVLDWDSDGDLDAWISNRNAPRLRLMRNDTPRRGAYLALRLRGNGTTCNRDAIGARIEVVLTEADGRKSIKTLKAGEGFISQTTKWLHFGLGENPKIEKVLVRWPDRPGVAGDVEEFASLEANRRYLLVQGSGVGEPVAPRQITPLVPSKPKVFRPQGKARIPLVTLFRPPKMFIRSEHNDVNVTTGEGKVVLLNLWATWCQPCLKELVEYSERSDELRQAGVEVVAFSVDSLDPNHDPSQPIAFLNRIQFPFASATAAADMIQGLEGFDRLLTAINRPLPVPTSFLIDGEGRLAAIYKGGVSVDDLLRDVNHSKRNRRERWLAAAPLGGRSIDHPHVDATAEAYEATLHFRRGTVLARTSGQTDNAEYSFLEAIRYHQDFAAAHSRLGAVLLQKDDLDGAFSHLQRAVVLDSTIGWGHHNLARVHVRRGNLDTALDHLREAIRYEPEETFLHAEMSQPEPGRPPSTAEQTVLQLYDRLAFRMATDPSEQVRNGAEAVRWAQRGVTATDSENATMLRTLAAAQAEVGRYSEAVTTTRRATALLRSSGDDNELLDQLQRQRELFESRRPLRVSSQRP